jgi:hypothetical protein
MLRGAVYHLLHDIGYRRHLDDDPVVVEQGGGGEKGVVIERDVGQRDAED